MARSVRLFGVPVALMHLAVFLGLAFATLAVAGAFTKVDAWYDALSKPAWTPPGWLIGTVWTVLYTLIGIASAVAWNGSDARLRRPLFAGALGFNLVLNATWSYLFFTAHETGAAVVEIALLALSTVALVAAAYLRTRAAGALLAPYAVWVVFAGFLNYTIWRLNP